MSATLDAPEGVTELAGRYAARTCTALQRAARGAPVVGVVGRDVPAALVAAAGGEPFRVPPRERGADEVAEAAQHLGAAVDRASLLVAAAVLAGELDPLRGLLVAHDGEGSVRLHAVLHELHRRGRTTLPVHLVDQVHLPRESTVRFNVQQVLSMLRTVEAWTGGAVTGDSLAVAWAQQQRTTAVLRDLRDARPHPAGPSGTVALHAYGLAAAPGAETAAVVEAALARPTPRRADDLPLWLTGSAPIGDDLYRLLESAGAVVVGEDHDWGDPVLGEAPVGPAPRTREAAAEVAVRARLAGAPAAATSTMAARAAATAAGVARTGARALLAVVRAHDDAPAWDFSRQRAAAGVPAALVRGAAADDPQAVLDALAALRRSL